MNLRRLTDPLGKWVMRQIQSEEAKEEVKDTLTKESQDSDKPSGLTEVEEEFLDLFEIGGKKYIFVFLLVIAVLLAIDVALCGAMPNQVFGLSIDIFGALLLGKGVLKGPYTITGSTGFGTSRRKQHNLTEGSVDGIYDVFFLVLGLLAQIAAISGLAVTPSICPI